MSTSGRTASKAKALPPWLAKSAQSLAYWMAYRHSLLPRYALAEGAIVNEFASAITSHMAGTFLVRMEVPYKQFLSDISHKTPKERIDLAVFEQPTSLSASALWSAPAHFEGQTVVIEVKRSTSGKVNIRNDLHRLRRLLLNSPGRSIRAFVVVTYEATKQKGKDNYFFKKNTLQIFPSGSSAFWRKNGAKNHIPAELIALRSHVCVRRIFKASASVDHKNANFRPTVVCVLEVCR
jgi:hypothetical protein